MPTQDLKVRIGAEDRASPTVKRVTNAIKLFIGAYVGVKLVQAVKRTADEFKNYGLQIDKVNKMTGVAVDKLQKLRYAAEQEHSSFEALEKGLANLTIRLGYAGDGLETYTRYFNALHIEYKKADGTLRDAYDVFLDLADVVSQGELSTEKLAATIQLFGARAGKELIPLLKKGSGYFREMGEEAERLGVILDQTTISQIKALDDAMVRVQTAFRGIAYQFFTPIVAAAEVFARNFSKLLEFNKDSVRNWGETVVQMVLETAQTMARGMGAFLNEWAEMGDAILALNEKLIRYNPIRQLFPGDMEERIGKIDYARHQIEEFQDQVMSTSITIDGFFESWKRGLLSWKPTAFPKLETPPLLPEGEDNVEATTDALKELDDELDKKKPAVEEVNTIFDEMYENVKAVAREIMMGIVDSLIFAQQEAKNLGDWIQSILHDLMRIGIAAAMHAWIPGFQHGGVIPGYSTHDDTVIRAMRGEGVVTHKGMSVIGETGLNALNRGENVFNTPVTINVQLGAGSGTQQAQEFLRIVQDNFGRMHNEAIRRRQLPHGV